MIVQQFTTGGHRSQAHHHFTPAPQRPSRSEGAANQRLADNAAQVRVHDVTHAEKQQRADQFAAGERHGQRVGIAKGVAMAAPAGFVAGLVLSVLVVPMIARWLA
jgi:hypothetical protein